MVYNEAYEERQKMEDALLAKWGPAIEEAGVCKTDHMARTTAILMENYMGYLKSDPRLIAEDQMTTSSGDGVARFQGINLALLGLLARTIPAIIGADLVGIQAMPTPRSPIFTLRWQYDNTKGGVTAGDEPWYSPQQKVLGLDTNYSSEIVDGETVAVGAAGAVSHALVWGGTPGASVFFPEKRVFIYSGSLFATLKDADGNVIDEVYFEGAYDVSATIAAKQTAQGKALKSSDSYLAGLTFTTSTRQIGGSIVTTGLPTGYQLIASYEYQGESEPNVPEMSFKIVESYIETIRRQLRGKYTMDAAYDAKVLHGINIENEITDMMKTELMAEINREIVGDLRKLAAIQQTLDFNDFKVDANINVSHNYDDYPKLLLDAINKLCAKIKNVGRMGYGNFVVANPETLSWLDRVPGFEGSGISYNGRELSFSGSMGGKIKFYNDPNYPQNEFLIGYKGSGALDTGYMHCPYLPITATPTMINPETGNPSKMFYTRYGKTFNTRDKDSATGVTNHILMGQWQYARLKMKNMPTYFASIGG